MLTVVPDLGGGGANGAADGSVSLLDEIVTEGARRMLAVALEAEITTPTCPTPPSLRGLRTVGGANGGEWMLEVV